MGLNIALLVQTAFNIVGDVVDGVVEACTYKAETGDPAYNATTGVLTFVTAPDYEIPTDADTNNAYLVTVMASDGVNSDTQALTVTVTDDVADNVGGGTTGQPMGLLLTLTYAA